MEAKPLAIGIVKGTKPGTLRYVVRNEFELVVDGSSVKEFLRSSAPIAVDDSGSFLTVGGRTLRVDWDRHSKRDVEEFVALVNYRLAAHVKAAPDEGYHATADVASPPKSSGQPNWSPTPARPSSDRAGIAGGAAAFFGIAAAAATFVAGDDTFADDAQLDQPFNWGLAAIVGGPLLISAVVMGAVALLLAELNDRR